MSPSRIDLGRRRNASRDIHATIRPLVNNCNLASIRVSSCEVRKLESEICNRRSRKRVEAEEVQEGCGLEVQGVGSIRCTNESSVGSRTSASGTRMRMTAGSFRVKSHQGELGSHSVELMELLRRPTFKKDHFVFSLADKVDSPDSTPFPSQPGWRPFAIFSGKSITPTDCSPSRRPRAPTRLLLVRETTVSWFAAYCDDAHGGIL